MVGLECLQNSLCFLFIINVMFLMIFYLTYYIILKLQLEIHFTRGPDCDELL